MKYYDKMKYYNKVLKYSIIYELIKDKYMILVLFKG